jgi:hypothetical protein
MFLGERNNSVDQQKEIKASYIHKSSHLSAHSGYAPAGTDYLGIRNEPGYSCDHQPKARCCQKTSGTLVALMINFGTEPIQFHRVVKNIKLSMGVLSRSSL